MSEFSGVRIAGYDTYHVIVNHDGLTYVLEFSASRGRLLDEGRKPYGPTIEDCARRGFIDWCERRNVSHSGLDMA